MWKNYFKKVGRWAMVAATISVIVSLFWFGYPLTALGVIGIWMALAFSRGAKVDDDLGEF